MICLDINLEEPERERVERIRQRAIGRVPSNPRRRTLYLREQQRGSWLVGGEVSFLSGIAQARIDGELLKVDGLFEGGVKCCRHCFA